MTRILFLIAAGAALLHAEVSALHPRIFVRNDSARIGRGLTVSQLRRRAADPAYARWRREVPSQGAAAIVERAARYLEDGNAADLAAVRDFLSTRTFSYEKNDVGGFLAGAEMATAFDWVYAGLAPAERAAAMANIVTTADSSAKFLNRGGPDINHNYTYMALATVAVCGLALDGEPEPYGTKAAEYLALARRFIEPPGMVIDTWNAREGAWGEGSHYTFHETVRNLVLMLAAFRSAGDTDYFSRIDMAKAGRFLIASTRPDMTFERIGDTSANRVQANLTVPVTVEMLASGLADAAEAARLRSFSQALLEAYGDKAVHPFFGWGMRIYFDPNAPRTPSYQTLPLAMRLGAGTYEHIMWRNGWKPDSTLITILAGDHFTDHQHFDKGQFLIYHRGGLTIDGGAYDAMYKPNQHPNEYAPRTLAHNCLLVYDPDEALPKGYTNDGGQQVLRGKQHHDDWPSYLDHRVKEGLHAAEVRAYDHDEANQYDYVRMDLARAYGAKVAAYDRQFVYLPGPDLLAIYDRVSAAKPEFQKRWLLHFDEEPDIDGAAPGPGIKEYPGARLTTVRRHGEYDPGGGRVVYDGVLFVRTLLPAERTVTVVGGPGYEFYNLFNRTNYPPSRPQVAAQPRESGTWRIEVSPNRAAKDDRFLHVLQMADPGTERPAAAQLIEDKQGRVVGALCSTAGENHVVLFAAQAGPVALPVSYEVSSPVPARHLVTELPPGAGVVVEVNGKTTPARKVNSQGILNFRDVVKGTRRVMIRPAR